MKWTVNECLLKKQILTLRLLNHRFTKYNICPKVQKTTGQPIDRLSFVISAQVDLPRH